MKLGAPTADVHQPTTAASSQGATAAAQNRFTDFVSLTKPRLNMLVLITTLAGLYLASPSGAPWLEAAVVG